jgi:hypothetical protein
LIELFNHVIVNESNRKLLFIPIILQINPIFNVKKNQLFSIKNLKMKRVIISSSIVLLFFSIITTQFLYGQPLTDRYKKYGEIIISELSNSPFPHQKRMSGHTYSNKSYSFEEHYNDSTVLIFIPNGYQGKRENDFVIHFHGWYNNVDSVLSHLN